MKNILFSGVKPTGKLHIGNYLGALKNWVDLQDKYSCIYSIVDYHALTVAVDPDELKENTRNMAILLLSIGIDPKKSILFKQSSVPLHTELTWIFNCITPVPELERMTQYKDLVKTHQKVANTGMLTYPVLQAADILIYKAGYVPVGEDQLQHLELSRIIAKKFNNRYKKQVFPEIKPILPEKQAARIMSLTNPDKKMSKSHGEKGAILLNDSPEIIRKKISKAVTDSGDTSTTLTGGHNLLMLFKQFAPTKAFTEAERKYKLKSLSYSELKKDMAEHIINFLQPIQEKQDYYRKNEKTVDKILDDGAKKATKIAEKTMKEVKETIGLN